MRHIWPWHNLSYLPSGPYAPTALDASSFLAAAIFAPHPLAAAVALNSLALAGQKGQLLAIQYVTASGNGTYTPTPGTRRALVKCIAGGSGGGGVTGTAGQDAAGAGGSSGGYSEALLTINSSTTYLYTVGAKGTGGANTGAQGNAGGDTYFGNSSAGSPTGATVRAVAGTGGFGMIVGTLGAVSVPGSGSTTNAVGDRVNAPASGNPGIRLTATAGIAGNGGSMEPWGSGGPGAAAGHGQANGRGYGAGGSGANSADGTAAAGGDGTDGLLVIYEFS